jgi:hypothetical protein
MNNNNILDDEYRRNFIKSADGKSLNDYLKNIERLSKKGGVYLEIYNKDIDFILTLNDTIFQDGGSIFNLVNEKKEDDENENKNNATMTEQVCDTEGYIKRIDNIINKTSSQKVQELSIIKQHLTNNQNNKMSIIQRFVDIVKNTDNSLTQEEFNLIKQIINIIASNKNYMKNAYTYMGKVLDKNKISEEFIKKLSELRNNKANLTKIQYNKEKENLLKNYVKKYGFNSICVSKLVEKIIYAYKNFS